MPFLAHATMESINATVHLKPDSCEIWTGTHVLARVQSEAARAAGLPVEKVIANNHLLGGGFGRKLEPDMVVKAVRIAKQVDGPVKVIWTREEDMQHDVYRPVYRDTITATLSDGKIVGWKYKISGSSIIARWLPPAFQKGVDIDAVDSAVDTPYEIPNFQVEYVRAEPPAVPTGFWRGVGPNNNVFAVECFMDELARKVGKDPIEFRRSMLGNHPRFLAALDLAADKSGWGRPLPPGVGRGVCLQPSFASFIVTIVEAEVDEVGEVDLRRVTCAVDTGIAVNPDTIVAQLQGGLIFGLTAALYGEITIQNGRVQQSNFNDYRMLRIDQTPKIEVHVIKSGEAHGGIGETGATARAAQRHLCRNRHSLAADACRPCPDRGEEEIMKAATRRILLGVVAIIVIAAAAGAWMIRGPGPMAFAEGPTVAFADYKGADPTGVPTSLGKASQVERGEYLARAADCMVCHTVPGGKEYAGGLGFKLPFGTLYSTNITPDKDTGIGSYSDQDFLNALHRGVRRDGARLYAAMPYMSYTCMSDADALAIKAYLFSLSPVRASAPANTLTFPFNQRWGMMFWSALFQSGYALRTRYVQEMEQGRLSRRSSAHCGECHTPRNLAFALDNREKFGGAITAGWRAFNISSDKVTGIGAWHDDDLISYLSIGHARGHGTASGPMGEAVDQSFSQLAPEDIHAVVAIFGACPRSPRLISPRRWRRRHQLRTAMAPRAIRAARWCSGAPVSVVTAGPARARFLRRQRLPAPGRLMIQARPT
jgi:mono/diheme cytochrome c family protein